MKDVEQHIDAQVKHIKVSGDASRKKQKIKEKKVLHSLPISEEERAKREHEVEEQRRFVDMPGTFKITRNVDHFITKIRKQVEDIVLEETYTRDANDYIIGIESRIKKETKA